LDALNESMWGGKAGCVAGQFTSEETANQLLEDVLTASNGTIDQVVATMGAFVVGPPPTQLSLAKVNELMADFTAHFLCAKAFLPILGKRAGSYIATTGMLGEVCPAPHLASTTIKAAAQLGLCQAFLSEYRQGPARFYELRIGILFMEESKENLSPSASPMGPVHGAHRLGRLYASLLDSGLPSQVVRVATLQQVEEFCPHGN